MDDRAVLFLSRVSCEFKDDTKRMVSLGMKGAFPNLKIVDQDYLCDEEKIVEADLTINKLSDWIDDSDHVFLIVGSEPGSLAKIPSGEGGGLRDILDFKVQSVYDDLVDYFVNNGAMNGTPTYTQIEGVLALGLGKKPLVFLDDSPGKDSQEQYRDWLSSYDSSGNDRKRFSKVELEECLQEANSKIAQEGLSRNQTLWSLLDDLVSEKKPKKSMAKLRRFAKNCEIDWVEDVWFESNDIPMGVYRGFSEESVEVWFIEYSEHYSIRDSISGEWNNYSKMRNEYLEEVTFDGHLFWVLVSHGPNYSLFCPQAKRKIVLDELKNYSAASTIVCFVAEKFWIKKGCDSFVLDLNLSDEIKRQNFCDNIVETNLIRRYSQLEAWPFNRRFGGRTYESNGTDGWALIQTNEGSKYVTLKPGRIADLFQIAQVDLCDNEEIKSIAESQSVYYLILKSDSGKKRFIRLFASQSSGAFQLEESAEFNGFLKPEGEDVKPIDVDRRNVTRIKDSRNPTFCYIERELLNIDSHVRIKVWLIPEEIDKNMQNKIKQMTSNLEVLPKPVISEVGKKDPFYSLPTDSWWIQLWGNIKSNT